MKNDKEKKEYGEDATKYGEFVSSFFGWVPLEKQKERIDELEKMTNEEKMRNNEKKEEK